MPGKARNLGLLAAALVLTLAVWFAGTAALPALLRDGLLAPGEGAMLTGAVQLGFVAGTLASALLNLADRLPGRLLFLAGALLAAAATAALAWLPPNGWPALLLRGVAGAAMAGVYPVGMKLAAGWARGDLGLLIGLIVGALTVGSASPHLIPALWPGLPWQALYLSAAGLAMLGGLLVLGFREGPAGSAPRPPFRLDHALTAWRDPKLRLANAGYLGHMWELYAMWAWIGAFFQALDLGPRLLGVPSGVLTFAVIALGGLGTVPAGRLADRWDRCWVCAGAMLASGTCALLVGPAAQLSLWLCFAIALVWGVVAVADSAQFSATVVTLSPPALVGTMLTVQTCLGFLLTVGTIRLLPAVEPALGWEWLFAVLAIGPFLGAWAMLRLRAML